MNHAGRSTLAEAVGVVPCWQDGGVGWSMNHAGRSTLEEVVGVAVSWKTLGSRVFNPPR